MDLTLNLALWIVAGLLAVLFLLSGGAPADPPAGNTPAAEGALG